MIVPDVFRKPMTGDLRGDFVVFLVRMRFNRPWTWRGTIENEVAAGHALAGSVLR